MQKSIIWLVITNDKAIENSDIYIYIHTHTHKTSNNTTQQEKFNLFIYFGGGGGGISDHLSECKSLFKRLRT